jgi:hypothetical protein
VLITRLKTIKHARQLKVVPVRAFAVGVRFGAT